MTGFSTLPLLACGLVLTGCGSVRPVVNHVANAKRLTDGTYEIEIRYSKTTSGGPCFNGLSWFRSTTHNYTDLIRLESIHGTVSAEQMVVLNGPTRWAIKGLRGSITFTNWTMSLQLQQPYYDENDVPKDFRPYQLNGVYQITYVPAPNPQVE